MTLTEAVEDEIVQMLEEGANLPSKFVIFLAFSEWEALAKEKKTNVVKFKIDSHTITVKPKPDIESEPNDSTIH